MPYITEKQKDRLHRVDALDSQYALEAENMGELTYTITHQLISYWHQHPHKYQTLGEIVASLEVSKLEFYRRVVVPYEKHKMKENGDVYE